MINKGLIASYVLATFFLWTFATLKFFSFFKTSAHKRWQKRSGYCLINGIRAMSINGFKNTCLHEGYFTITNYFGSNLVRQYDPFGKNSSVPLTHNDASHLAKSVLGFKNQILDFSPKNVQTWNQVILEMLFGTSLKVVNLFNLHTKLY